MEDQTITKKITFSSRQVRSTIHSLKNTLRKSFFIPIIIFGFFVLVVAFLAIRAVISHQASVLPGEDEKVQLAKPKATQVLNKEFQFSLKDENGKEVSKIRYILESVEIRDELIVKGKRARAVEGRTFLVLKLKIVNDFKQSIKVNARDYVRLTLNDGKDRFAADIHNDPVEVQADSTKQTRLAFPINENDKNLVLHIGELTGKKESIKLNVQ